MTRHQQSRRGPVSAVRRFLRTRAGRCTALVALGLAVLVGGLLAQGYLNSPAPALGSTPEPDARGGLDSVAPSVPASASAASSAGSTAGGGPASASEVLATLKRRFADNPLNHLRADGMHRVSVSVSSSRRVKVLGYLVPTGVTAPYGTPRPDARTWSLTQQAYGPGYLAAVFVQADGSGAAITCTVSVDGQTTNSETTSGQYGRAVCLG